MIKGDVSLRDLVSLLSAAGRVRVYRGNDDEVVFSGYKGNLVHDSLMDEGLMVRHVHQGAEFYGRRQNGPFSERKNNEKKPVTEESAGEYFFSDLVLELWTDIYCY